MHRYFTAMMFAALAQPVLAQTTAEVTTNGDNQQLVVDQQAALDSRVAVSQLGINNQITITQADEANETDALKVEGAHCSQQEQRKVLEGKKTSTHTEEEKFKSKESDDFGVTDEKGIVSLLPD